jgi:nicotinamide mononucleotide transporter
MEYAAALFGLTGVFLNARKMRLGFVFGLFSVLPYVWIFAQSGLVGNAVLNFYFAVTCVSGWFFWRKNAVESENYREGKMTVGDFGAAFFLFILVFASLLLAYNNFLSVYFLAAEGVERYADVAITALSVSAQYLLMKGKRENWLLWIPANVISTVLFLSNGLYPTAALYFFYTILAIYGFLNWKDTL